MLKVPFDPTYKSRWHRIRKITGDLSVKRGTEIKPVGPIRDQKLLEEFRALPRYEETMTLLGYTP